MLKGSAHPSGSVAIAEAKTGPGLTGSTAAESLHARVSRVAHDLAVAVRGVTDLFGGQGVGPQRLADQLGLDKVLASRVLSALRERDDLATLHRMPGPAPLRRLVAAAHERTDLGEAKGNAERAIDAYEQLIRSVGDRSSLDSIMSVWVPEARQVFELRRKQALHRAMSQLRGVEIDVLAETGLLLPNPDGRTIDVIWCKALVGLTRLTPGGRTKLSSIRHVTDAPERRPTTLAGEPLTGMVSAILPEFSSPPSLAVIAESVGETTQYLVSDEQLPIGTRCTLTTCEVNRGELARYVPTDRGRRAWMSSEVAIPARKLQLDLLISPDLFDIGKARLDIFDTAIRGHVDLNDPSRATDRLDLEDSLDVGRLGLVGLNHSAVPDHRRLMQTVCDRLGVFADELNTLRVESEYPVYGSQYIVSFDTRDRPAR